MGQHAQRDCYLSSVHTIDQMGEFILSKCKVKLNLFGGISITRRWRIAKSIATAVLPALRGIVFSNKRVIAHYTDHEDALAFAGSKWAKQLGDLGTSCPDHFLRTRICPMFIDCMLGEESVDDLKKEDRGRSGHVSRGLREIL